MELNISGAIRRLRQERNVTQEELANAVGVTAQAVSKWERNEGYPDITLLPEIAGFFGVDLDAVCGLDEQRDQSAICRIRSETMYAQSYDEGVRIAREGLAKYPHSYRMKENLAFALRGCPGRGTPPKEVLAEIIRLYEEIIAHCPERDLVYSVLAEVWEVYECAGEHEKAVEAARRLPGFYETSDRVLTFLLRGKERVEHFQNCFINILPHLDAMMRSAVETDCYSVEEKIAVYRKMLAIFEIADECHNWPVGMVWSIRLCRMTAKLYLELGDISCCLDMLGKAADLAVAADSLVFEGYPESLLLNRIHFKYLAGPQNDRADLLAELEGDSEFDSIRDLPEYREIRSKLAG